MRVKRDLMHTYGMSSYYAEDQIDRVVREAFFRDPSYKGVIVEVGAAGPEYLSTSRHFRESGWKVLAIEPNPEFCELHRKAGFEILQYACGDRDEDNVDFEVVFQPAEYKGGKVTYESFSSLKVLDSYRALKPDIETRRIKVDLRRLDTILAQHAPDVRVIDILTIDVEGWELAVMAGLSPRQRHDPRVVIMENLMGDKKYRSYMRERGYRLHREMNPNDIYVAS
jgi:FkbM family methyltransferase